MMSCHFLKYTHSLNESACSVTNTHRKQRIAAPAYDLFMCSDSCCDGEAFVSDIWFPC